jgi:hypothetical protein
MSAVGPAQAPRNCALQQFIWIIAKTAWLHEECKDSRFDNEFQLLV